MGQGCASSNTKFNLVRQPHPLRYMLRVLLVFITSVGAFHHRHHAHRTSDPECTLPSVQRRKRSSVCRPTDRAITSGTYFFQGKYVLCSVWLSGFSGVAGYLRLQLRAPAYQGVPQI